MQDNRKILILIYDLGGTLRSVLVLVSEGADTISISAVPAKDGVWLAIYLQTRKKLVEIQPATGKTTTRALPFLEPNSAIYPTAFPTKDARVLATGAQPLLSTMLRVGAKGAKKVDVGFLENQFWTNARAHGVKEEGRYVKNMDYAHIRTDIASPAYANPALAESNDPRDAQQMLDAGRAMKQLQKPLSAKSRKLWEPTFTHRMPFSAFAEWSKINDANGLPKYLSLTRHNKPVTYGEFGKTADFSAATYALGVPALDRLYELPLRGFLQGLAVRQRENPELLISVEPNHEHEIAIEEDETIGDYNPAMIAGFREYSQKMLGWTKPA